MAREARSRANQAISENSDAIAHDAIIAILMSALAVEAFINELAEAADMADLGLGIPSPAFDLFRDLGNTLLEVEAENGSVGLKYQVAAKILSGHTFDRGGQTFQGLRELFSLRNQLVHLKPSDKVDPDGFIVPSHRLIKSLQDRGLTRSRGRQPGDPPGGMSWLLEIQTDKMANWACRIASNVLGDIGGMIPDVGGQIPIISSMVAGIRNLPE